MYTFIGGRGTGKTYKLLEVANETKGVIICSNPRAMREKARSWGFTEIKDFLSYQEKESITMDTNSLYIDNLEKFIQEDMGWRLKGYTYTIEEDENR